MPGRVLIYISYAIHLGLTRLHPHTTTLTHQASHISLHMAFTILKTQANFTHGKCIFTTFSHSRVRKLPAHFSADNLFATYQANADQQVFFTFSCNFTLPAQALSINSNSQVMRVTKFKNRLYTLRAYTSVSKPVTLVLFPTHPHHIDSSYYNTCLTSCLIHT